MFWEHPNGDLTKVDSPDVKFFEDEFQSVGETKMDLELYELQDDNQLSFNERRICTLIMSPRIVLF